MLVEAEELKFSQDCEIITSDCREWSLGESWGESGSLALGGEASDEIRNVISTIIMTKFINLYFKILFCPRTTTGHKLLFIIPSKFGMSEGI